MSSTNLTKNLKLPQFVASDKPSWLGDVNGAMLNIDNGYGTLTADISNANDTASSAKSQSDANTQTLVNVNSELQSQGNRITALEAGGGTEQLEQRVGTLETDVESLQTRADTFEEEITENTNNVTTLSGRVTTVEGKVKTNEDNITSLQTSNTDILSEIEALHTINTQQGKLISNAQTTATQAKNTADATQSNLSVLQNTVNNLSSNVSSLSNNSTKIVQSDFSGNTTYVNFCSKITMHYTTNSIYFEPIFIRQANNIPANTPTPIGTFSLPSEVTTVISGTGTSEAGTMFGIHMNSSGTAYITVSGTTATLYANLTTTGTSYGTYCINLNNVIYQ